MNHRFRGRTWSDNPEPAEVRADPYAIKRVALRVATEHSRGRWEGFTASRPLLLRFDALGLAAHLRLLGMTIAGEPVPTAQATALHLYLKASKGLKYFRRAIPFGSTRAELAALLELVGINYHHYVQEPTSEVPAGRSHPTRA